MDDFDRVIFINQIKPNPSYFCQIAAIEFRQRKCNGAKIIHRICGFSKLNKTPAGIYSIKNYELRIMNCCRALRVLMILNSAFSILDYWIMSG